jgi:hypothetical protein
MYTVGSGVVVLAVSERGLEQPIVINASSPKLNLIAVFNESSLRHDSDVKLVTNSTELG